MKYLAKIFFVLVLGSVSIHASASDTDPDKDVTPVVQCESLPPSVSIDAAMSWSGTTKFCHEMMRILVGVRHKDITNFEKAIAVLRFTPPNYDGDADRNGIDRSY